MCILISFNGIYHCIVKCTNHSFLTWGSPRIPNHWWLTWKILECELDLLKAGNIFFYFPLPFSKYSAMWSCFMLFCFVLFLFFQYFNLTTLSNRAFPKVFWGGKGRRRRHGKKAHLTAPLAPVQQNQCLVFSPHSFKWYIWSCHRIGVCLWVTHTNLDDGTQVY